MADNNTVTKITELYANRKFPYSNESNNAFTLIGNMARHGLAQHGTVKFL